MAKWADYCISKISQENKTVSQVIIHKDNDTTIGDGEEKDRNWLVQKATSGYTFCCITKTKEGKWQRFSD
jgi:hypothetical protein